MTSKRIPADGYHFELLAHACDSVPCMSGFFGEQQLEAFRGNFVLEVLRMEMDARIPTSASGYIAQILSPMSIRKVREDALRQLARHVPIYSRVYESTPNGIQAVGFEKI